jgi:hypothetical protein
MLPTRKSKLEIKFNERLEREKMMSTLEKNELLLTGGQYIL